jgi:hypothetical protein
MQHDDLVYLAEMYDFAVGIAQRANGLERASFDADEDLRLAIVQLLAPGHHRLTIELLPMLLGGQWRRGATYPDACRRSATLPSTTTPTRSPRPIRRRCAPRHGSFKTR